MKTHMVNEADDLVFAALGGVGEIGMNLSLYGFGPADARKWIIVDLGITFADSSLPGIDRIMADTSFIEERRDDLLAIIITHAHEDHYGAIIDLWPRLRAPIYASPFTVGLLRAKMAAERFDMPVPIHVVSPGERFDVGPFDVEYIAVTHSIPEASGLAIRTPMGMVYHSGDWKIDPNPQIGPTIDSARLKALGAEKCNALICDSTNAMVDGTSRSEGDVRVSLERLFSAADQRVAITAFASNVARLRSIALAASACGRDVVVVGRAMNRVIAVAQETGHLEDSLQFFSEEIFKSLPRKKIVILISGSQGEPRAALARVAFADHPSISLSKGDMVIFSARAIPGNEKALGRVQNALVRAGIEIVFDEDDLVHVSGHPRKNELLRMYDWLTPGCVIPVHGEARHVEAHARLAESKGFRAVRMYNGDMLRLLPAPVEKIAEISNGRLYKDGAMLVHETDKGLRERKRLSHVGCIFVNLVMNKKNGQTISRDLIMLGVPDTQDHDRDTLRYSMIDVVDDTVASIPKAYRRDHDRLSEAVRKAVRAEMSSLWGKRPICEVMVTLC